MKKLTRITILLIAIFCIGAKPIIALASGPQGTYVEFKLTSDKANGSIAIYYMDGNSRSEINMEIPAMKGKGIKMITMTRKDSSDKVYILDESNKTYTEINSKDRKAKNDEDYEITVLGKEKVNNYNCIHVKVVDKTRNNEMEMWTSKEVMDYSFFKNLKNQYLASKNILNALEAKGADGFVVRMLNGKMQMDLVKAEKRDVNMSLFSLEGYTKSASPNILDNQNMMQNMQKMTPEERKKYIEQMKEQYNK